MTVIVLETKQRKIIEKYIARTVEACIVGNCYWILNQQTMPATSDNYHYIISNSNNCHNSHENDKDNDKYIKCYKL